MSNLALGLPLKVCLEFPRLGVTWVESAVGAPTLIDQAGLITDLSLFTSKSGVYSSTKNVSYLLSVLSFGHSVLFLWEWGTESIICFNSLCGYPLLLNSVYSFCCICLYWSLSEHALSSLVSSPLTKLLNVFLGCAEFYCKY